MSEIKPSEWWAVADSSGVVLALYQSQWAALFHLTDCPKDGGWFVHRVLVTDAEERP